MKKKIHSFIQNHMRLFLVKFGNLELGTKFRTIYLFFILLCITINLIIVTFFYNHIVSNSIRSLAYQTLETTAASCDTTIRIISKSSTYLLGNTDVQAYLSPSVSDSKRTILSKNLRNSLYLSLETMPSTASIIIMGMNSEYEYAARYSLPEIVLSNLEEASWYQDVYQKQGAPVFALDGGNLYSSTDEHPKYITLVRLVNSTETAKPLGYMIINIPITSLIDTSATNHNSSDFCILADDTTVMEFQNSTLNEYFAAHSLETCKNNSEKRIFIDGKSYFVLSKENEQLGLTYYSLTPYTFLSGNYASFLLISLITIIISAIMFVPIAFLTKHYITDPITRLSDAMTINPQGTLSHVSITSYDDEIGHLQASYNEMILEIQNLMDAKINEQKHLRKAELSILQEQIKPHFLYNTLNGISYLIISEQKETANKMILTLSDYYRESLSKGSEFIPLQTEINIVKNYLCLQKMRFPNLFEDSYDIDDEAKDIIVPRLFLQPLVENSLYHGIIPTCDSGLIRITARKQGMDIIITVRDNGVGMNAETLHHILSDSNDYKSKSFGLKGTLERLKILYEKEDIYTLESYPDQGTTITFKIPVQKEIEDGTTNNSTQDYDR